MTVMASSSLFLSSSGFSSSIPISCSIRSPLIQSRRQHPVVLNLKKNLGFKGLACFCTLPSSESSLKVQKEVSAVQQVTDAVFEKEKVDGEAEVGESEDVEDSDDSDDSDSDDSDDSDSDDSDDSDDVMYSTGDESTDDEEEEDFDLADLWEDTLKKKDLWEDMSVEEWLKALKNRKSRKV